MKEKALVLFSGGLDSTACLLWALGKFSEVTAMYIDYGQKNKIERESFEGITSILVVKKVYISIDGLFQQFTKDAMTSSTKLGEYVGRKEKREVPTSFVPGRNHLFLTLAAMKAYELGIKNIVIGISQTGRDFYPDNRDLFAKSVNVSLNIAMDTDFTVHTKVMFNKKEETIKEILSYGIVGEKILGMTYTCYTGKKESCGKCGSCKARLEAFNNLGKTDPLIYKI